MPWQSWPTFQVSAVAPRSLGAELEMYIVDAQGMPLYANQEILADAGDPQLTLELNRYNLEYQSLSVCL